MPPRVIRVLRSLSGALLLLAAPLQAAPTILFIAGEPSHGPGEHRFPEGCALLADALRKSGLDVRAEVSRGWPDEGRLAQARSIVLYSDGLDRHVAKGHEDALREHLQRKGGVAVLHFAVEPGPGELAELMLRSIGGRFDEGWSVNPVWNMERAQLAEHAVTRGVTPFSIEDEWYYHLRFRDGAVPVLQALPPANSLGDDGPRSGNAAVRAELAAGKAQTLGWIFEHEETRAFGFTGGHFHRNWSHADFLRLVLNGIVWTAHVEIPADGVPVSVEPAPRYTTIDEAIARGDAADVKLHLAADPARANLGRDAALAPLHQAILRNRTEIAALLVDAGADVNRPDRSQRTPLHLAVERANLPVLESLLARGARTGERDRIGWTPLHHAAAKDKLAIARGLLRGGADVNALSLGGGTPLHEAAASGSAEMVQLLLEAGVNPGVVSKTGVTALDVAKEFGNEAAIKLLAGLDGGAAKK